jgi:large subunit ribosomal protein L31
MAKKPNQVSKVSYYPQAVAKCMNCGSTYTLGLTTESLNLEICANCHPFYTGQEMLVDTAGRIEKFQAKANKAVAGYQKKVKIKTRKNKTSVIDDIVGNVDDAEVEVKKPEAETVETN